MVASPSADSVFQFGKHKGRTFADVASSESGYARWALAQESPSGNLKAFVEYCRLNLDAGVVAKCSAPAIPSAPSAAYERPTEGTWLLCELAANQKFSVRAESAPSQVQAARGRGVRDSAFMSPQVFEALKQLEGARTAGAGCIVFPLASYQRLLPKIESIARVERIPDWVMRFARSSPNEAAGVLKPERLPEGLLSYQLEGVRFGVERDGRCFIGDEMGLGKSVQALALAAQYLEDWPLLVICPSSLRWVWREQVLQWLPDLVEPEEVQIIKKGSDTFVPDAKVWITSYHMLAADAKTAARGGDAKFQVRPDGSTHGMIILDESHNIKDWSSERTKAIVPLVRKATRAVLLSGTPTRNSADELHSQLWALLPWFSPKMADFKSRYCLQASQHVPGGRIVNRVVGSRNARELNHVLTSKVMVRRLKRDVLAELPEKRRQKVPLEITDRRLLQAIQTRVEGVPYEDLIGGGSEESAATIFQQTAKAKLPAVKEYIGDVLERCQEKVIIFAHHHVMLDALQELLAKTLPKEGASYVRIDGGTSQAKREEAVKKFQSEESCRVALLSITACSEGLTLTAAGLVIFAELYWVPGVVEQAESRAHRIGTKHTKVVVEFLVAMGTPDERIYRRLDSKKRDTSRMLDGAAESLNAEELTAPPVRAAPVRQKRQRVAAPSPAPAAAPAAAPATVPAGAATAPTMHTSQAEPKSPAPAPAGAAAARAREDAETPSPVDRSKEAAADRAKVEYLLRAIRQRQQPCMK
eukprot:TRINITY_DN62983_c0_g1_i1.p1 TRINITY_DN62983_c0_g1~~TRINITY_DN62983_c0_g1_i1.p1  ORF type:complete len:776 (-),score=190.93 TRINITY_DN62983_c0_g1_i1:157-2427(-)